MVRTALGSLVSRLRRRLVRPAPAGGPPTDGELGLRPGELVEVRPLGEIVRSLDAAGKHRGLEFCRGMERHCGGRLRVDRIVDRIVVEATGELRRLDATVALDGAACEGCPRRSDLYFREAWLRRV
jgi:hypothetical protein